MRTAVLVVVLLWSPSALALCATNGADQKLLFVFENLKDGARATHWLDPGAEACEPAERVYVFEDETADEGCHEDRASDARIRLVAYESFDRCTWAGE